ncbi:MAG: C4-type zinc ribbon domain-containing protein [Bacteroidia bacterium]|nr:C4-type zinc ribbon domain-containing protein [Bacteroidia bacterium]
MSKAKTDEISVEEKLRTLFELQQIDSKIDKIRTVRGELPLEVRDLEDFVAGLETRIGNFTEELKTLEDSIAEKKNVIKEAQALIKKYETQQGKVRNNREFDSLTKEMEFQNLEIQLAEKRIKEYKANIISKKEIAERSEEELASRRKDLKIKKKELEEIVAETEKEEAALLKKSKASEAIIDERLLNAYKRIRSNVMNGLGVVTVERDACGGCFNKIPPQRQLDIRMHKKIIVCEHCGRILVDAEILSGKPVKA